LFKKLAALTPVLPTSKPLKPAFKVQFLSDEYTIKPSFKLDNFLPNSESAFIFSSLFAPAYSRVSTTIDGSIESVKILSALIPLEPE
jgi:hypothetical protein